jgi:hypothetical protein
MIASRVLIVAPPNKGTPILRCFIARGFLGKVSTGGLDTLTQSNIHGAGPDLIVYDLRHVSLKHLVDYKINDGWAVPRMGILPAKTPQRVWAASRKLKLNYQVLVRRPLTQEKIDRALEQLGWNISITPAD